MIIDEWYRSYSSSVYQRSYDMRSSLYAEDYVEIDNSGTQLTLKLKYTDEDMHKFLWGDGEVKTLLLMDNGYQVNSGWHKDIEYFGYREGGHSNVGITMRIYVDVTEEEKFKEVERIENALKIV